MPTLVRDLAIFEMVFYDRVSNFIGKLRFIIVALEV